MLAIERSGGQHKDADKEGGGDCLGGRVRTDLAHRIRERGRHQEGVRPRQARVQGLPILEEDIGQKQPIRRKVYDDATLVWRGGTYEQKHDGGGGGDGDPHEWTDH